MPTIYWTEIRGRPLQDANTRLLYAVYNKES